MLAFLFFTEFAASCSKNDKNKENNLFHSQTTSKLIDEASQALIEFRKDTTLLQKELEKSKEQKDTIRQIAINRLLSDIYTENSKYPTSIRNKRSNLILTQKINDPVQELISLNALAESYITVCILDESLRLYLRALNIGRDLDAECTSIAEEKAKTWLGLGNIFGKFDKLNEANNYLDEAMQLASKTENRHLIANINLSKGEIAQQKHLYDSAHIYFNRALDEFIDLNSTAGLSEAFLMQGELSTARGEYDEAIVSLQNSLSTLERTSLRLLSLRANKALGNAFAKVYDYERAEKHMTNANDIAIELNLYRYLMEVNSDFEHMYRAQNKTAKADEHHNLVHMYDGKINESKMQNSLFLIFMDYQKEKNQKEIDDLRMEYRVKARTQWIIIFAISTIMVLILIIVVVYVFYLRMRSSKRKAIFQSTQLKIKLFDQINEDIKSPITIISGLAEKMKNSLDEGCSTKNIIDLDIIQKQAQNISFLINESVAFSDSKTAHTPSWINGDIVSYLQFLFNCYSDQANVRGVGLLFLSSQESIKMNFCKETIKIAINNLLSIAIEDSSKGEKVLMNVRYIKKDELCQISISHKALPESEHEIPETFKDTFAQTRLKSKKNYFVNKLAFTNQLVKEMDGVFGYQNKSNNDTVYNIELPVKNDKRYKQFVLPAEQELATTSESLMNELHKSTEEDIDSSKKGLVLVVEDNKFMVFYITSLLSDSYNVISASNGVEALSAIEKNTPDLIITDLMMPLMDGNELTSIVKKTPTTSHVPVIMITVKDSDKSRIESIKTGVDSFLEKPFNEEELKALVDQLLRNRKGLIKRLGQMIVDKQNRKDSKMENEDVLFIQKISEIIHSEIGNSDLSPQMIADKMFISSSHLNRKIKAITDFSTTGYILNLRLNRAKKLLVTTQKQIGEVAMECGFSDFAYFSRTFKKEFGITPSQYQRM